jgi:DNA-binding NtrC family response regulator
MLDYQDSTHNLNGPPARDEKQTILFVDDDDAILVHMSESLQMSGYGVASFHDAPSALIAIREGIPIDLIITDYRLPGMNGLEFVEALRSILPVVPVIMLTAYGGIDTYFKAFNLGVLEYIHKPLNKGEFLRIVKVALGKGMPGRAPAIRGEPDNPS